MIRRDAPLGATAPDQWLLVGQPDHARLSYELARAWGGPNVAPLVCPADAADHPLAATRREFLEAVLHHDDGWSHWIDSPAIDPASGRPRAFTEMPSADAQRIWSDSIVACRSIGTLAGWVVASHFSALQSKHDSDYAEWVDWLAQVDAQRTEWLSAWRSQSADHTEGLAQRCLAWLQASDWMSLWLCCRCPATPDDGPTEPLVVGDEATSWPPITFTPEAPQGEGARRLRVTPWPFDRRRLDLTTPARALPVGAYSSEAVVNLSRTAQLVWRLEPFQEVSSEEDVGERPCS